MLPFPTAYRSGLVFFFCRVGRFIEKSGLFLAVSPFFLFPVLIHLIHSPWFEVKKKERKGGWLIRTVLYYLPNTPAACRLEKVVTSSQACSSQTQQKKGICYMLFIRCIYFMYIYIFYISNLYAIWRYKIHVYIKYVYFEKKYIYIYTSWIITLSLEISRLFLAILKNVLEKS